MSQAVMLENEELRVHLPVGMRVNTARVETWEGTDRVRDALKASRRTAPLWRVEHTTGQVAFKQPILVRMYEDGAFVFAENDALGICGTGQTSKEALEDFAQHVVYFRDYYRNLAESQVIGEAARLKKLFSEFSE